MVGSGVKAFTLSKLMGHRTMRTTLMYVNNSIDNVENKWSGLRYLSDHIFNITNWNIRKGYCQKRIKSLVNSFIFYHNFALMHFMCR